MTDITQKEIDYTKVFLHSLHYGMVNKDEIHFLTNQFNEIDDEINLAMEFIDKESFNKSDRFMYPDNSYSKRTKLEYIKVYAVAVLPFMIFDGKITDPKKETKESYEDTAQFLRYILSNQYMANHLIANTTSNKYEEGHPPYIFDNNNGFDREKLSDQLGNFEFLSKLDLGREKRTWWGSSGAFLSCMLFTNSVYLAWSKPHYDGLKQKVNHWRKAEQDRIIYFIEDFFKHMGYPITHNTIKTHFYNKVKKNLFVLGNPYFTADNILI